MQTAMKTLEAILTRILIFDPVQRILKNASVRLLQIRQLPKLSLLIEYCTINLLLYLFSTSCLVHMF
jgi:hypothetical protein